MTDDELDQNLKDMIVPPDRRNWHLSENLRWLLRNIQIRNSDHPSCAATLDALRDRYALT